MGPIRPRYVSSVRKLWPPVIEIAEYNLHTCTPSGLIAMNLFTLDLKPLFREEAWPQRDKGGDLRLLGRHVFFG